MDLKRTININKKFIIILVLVNIIAISLYYSYALFQVNVLKNNVIVIQSASSIPTITTTIGNTNSNSFTLPANSSQTITVNLTVNKVNDVTITSAVAYKMYYELTGNGTFTVSSTDTYPDNKIEGSVTGTKSITLTFTNNSSNALTITLGAISGLEKVGAVLTTETELGITRSSTLSVIQPSMSLIYAGSVGYNTYTYDGDGTVTCNSQDTTKVICSVDTANHRITVTPVAYTLPIYINVFTSATTNYYATSTSFTVSVAKATPTMTLSAYSGTIACGGTTTLTVTTNSDGAISCSPPSGPKTTCSVDQNTKVVTINGKSGQEGSQIINIYQAAGTNYNAATNQTYNLTINACASWHYINGYGLASRCASSNYCPRFCQNRSSTSVWSCTTSDSVAPSDPSLESGKYCWCYY